MIIQAKGMQDVFGQALHDYYQNSIRDPLLLHNEYGPPEEIPVETYFYEPSEYSELEVFALQQVYGKTLDVGAASGRHAIFLQQKGIDITALDISPFCGRLMKAMGVENIAIEDVFDYQGSCYDTVYMLMNGAGVAGSIEGLKKLLYHCKKLVKQDGQILLDSTDISYLYASSGKPKDKYFGQLTFCYEYQGKMGDEFHWLYVDQQTLTQTAIQCGWRCQVIFEDETSAYLARLSR
jgi:SAM-dependent methyltransferase